MFKHISPQFHIPNIWSGLEQSHYWPIVLGLKITLLIGKNLCIQISLLRMRRPTGNAAHTVRVKIGEDNNGVMTFDLGQD